MVIYIIVIFHVYFTINGTFTLKIYAREDSSMQLELLYQQLEEKEAFVATLGQKNAELAHQICTKLQKMKMHNLPQIRELITLYQQNKIPTEYFIWKLSTFLL